MQTDTIQEYVTRIQSGDGGAMAGLWDEVKSYAYKVAARFDGLADPDDLRQEAFLAALAAAEHYNKGRGVPFLPYMGKCISFHLQRYITNSGAHIPVNKRALAARVARYKTNYYMTYGRTPKDIEIRSALDLTREQLQDLYLVAYVQVAQSTAAELEDGLELGDTIADPADRIEASTRAHDHKEMAAALWELVDSIDGGNILRMIYKEGMTLQEVADEKNVGAQAIHAKRNRLLRKIRTASTEKSGKIKSYHDEYIKGLYNKGGLTRFRHTGTSEPEWIALYRLYHGA